MVTDRSATSTLLSRDAARPSTATVLVANPAAPYSRGLRVARSLSAAGHVTTIVALGEPGLPSVERDGGVEVRRFGPIGPWARFAPGHGSSGPTFPGVGDRLEALADLGLKGLGWPAQARGWWSALRADAPLSDLYHACGILAIPIALELADRSRRAGLLGRVIYDVTDLTLESNTVQRAPGFLVGRWQRRERAWAARADAVVTVNDPIADHLVDSLRLRRRPTVLLNCPAYRPPTVPRPDLIRAATGIPADRRIVLFLGRLGPQRGLDEAAEAVLRLPDAALVILGFGAWATRLRQRDQEARFVGRHWTLPAVHPDLLLDWTASADASIVAVPGNSLNQRLSTPNKFWESLAAGTPIVVGRDLEVMRGIVEGSDIGAVADPADPGDLARALGRLVDAPEAARTAMRDRAIGLAERRYNWEMAVPAYLDLVARLAPRSRSSDAVG